MVTKRLTMGVIAGLIWLPTLCVHAQDDFDRPPISYAQATPENAISRLELRLNSGEVALVHEPQFGYLRSLLEHLEVPVASQTLVFSQTSLQRQRIRPRTPRALYYNDDVYIGYCHLGDVLEVSVADPQLGTVFYSVDQTPTGPVTFTRQTDSCLICHGGSQTRNIPGHLVRSVYPDASGQPLYASGTYRTDHESPLARRWGGWYVTGTHGSQTHLGNRIYSGRPREGDTLDETGFNVTDLSDRVRTSAYLSPHSDLVALMVLDHQATGHNVLTRASFDARSAIYREEQLNLELPSTSSQRRESTQRIIQGAADSLVSYFLFVDETRLTEPVAGTSRFERTFTHRGPRDDQGRSLRDFDLNTRLFKYPCSYLIYTDSFDALPADLREAFWQRMDAILSAAEPPAEFAHLTDDDRRAIREILAATKPGAPATWQR